MAQPIVVNNPGSNSDSSSGMGFLLAVVLVIAVVFALFYFGLPLIQRSTPQAPIVNIPDQIDVNIKQE